MKKIFLFVSPLIFLVACSSDSKNTTSPDILGCMDDCATNYNPDATSDAGQVCLYSFLGTYTVAEFKADGVSLFSNVWENPLVDAAFAFGVANNGVGVYGYSFIYTDGLEVAGNGTFVNNETQLIFYPSDGSAAELWTTTKINCLEFDGNSMSDGIFVEIELDYYSDKLDNLEKTPTNSKFDVTQFKRKK